MIKMLKAIAGLVVLASFGLGACGGDDSDAGSGSTVDSMAGDSTAGSSGSDADDPGRVVALGEEFLLADLLALGIQPVASTATVVDAGFQGVDEFDTEAIEALSGTEPNLEQLAGLRPDVIVATDFVVDYVGRDTLGSLGELVAVPSDDDPATRLRTVAEAFGREAQADALLADLDAAVTDATDAVAASGEPCVVSVATAYPSQLALWVDGPVNIPQALLDMGCELDPAPDAVEGIPGGATEGRAFVSLEQIGLLDAPVIVVMQSAAVEGEPAAYAALTDDPLWQALPAVEAGSVIELDRLAYPGVAGQIRLLDELAVSLS
jgi:iron complex transport system substrate-binding protein